MRNQGGLQPPAPRGMGVRSQESMGRESSSSSVPQLTSQTLATATLLLSLESKPLVRRVGSAGG